MNLLHEESAEPVQGLTLPPTTSTLLMFLGLLRPLGAYLHQTVLRNVTWLLILAYEDCLRVGASH